MKNINSVCYISEITNIQPIEGANRIELAIVEGWTSIVQKGAHKVGDLVICTTTDAVIPEELALKWGVSNYLRKGNRVRTVKLRGVYSECILTPYPHIEDVDLGDDLQDEFSIYKYEPPVKEILDSRGRKHKYHQNPNFPIYFKFPNHKNVPDIFTKEDYVIITRKIHGTNARYGIVKKSKLSILDRIRYFFTKNPKLNYEFVYGSHNVEKGSDSQGYYSEDVWKKVYEKYDIKNKLWALAKDMDYTLGQGLVIYGEIYGPGIQKGYDYGLTELKFAGFDVFYIDNYTPYDTEESVLKALGLPQVKHICECYWRKDIQDHYTFNQYWTNHQGQQVPHEGIVIKSLDGNRSKIAKCINPDYLIYSEKHGVEDNH